MRYTDRVDGDYSFIYPLMSSIEIAKDEAIVYVSVKPSRNVDVISISLVYGSGEGFNLVEMKGLKANMSSFTHIYLDGAVLDKCKVCIDNVNDLNDVVLQVKVGIINI